MCSLDLPGDSIQREDGGSCYTSEEPANATYASHRWNLSDNLEFDPLPSKSDSRGQIIGMGTSARPGLSIDIVDARNERHVDGRPTLKTEIDHVSPSLLSVAAAYHEDIHSNHKVRAREYAIEQRRHCYCASTEEK